MPETNGKDLSDELEKTGAANDPKLARLAMALAVEELPGLTEAEMAALEPKAAPMSANQAESILDAQVMQIMGVMVRGLIVSSAGVPPDVLLRSTARCFARVVGEAIAGDLAPVFKVRASVREAFEKTLRTIPVKPAPQPPGQRPGFQRQQG